MNETTRGDREGAWMSKTDEELIRMLGELVDQVEDEDLADEQAGGLDELLERRYADELKRARWAELDGDPDRARELDAWLEAVERRAGFRALAQELAP